MTTTDPSREADRYEDGAWYWVEREVWVNEPKRIAPAMYKAACDAWYSCEFSGIPTRELVVLEPCRRQVALVHKGADLWQPMANAPRDGTRVLLATLQDKTIAGAGNWVERHKIWLWPYPLVEPTHWAPIPRAPGDSRSGRNDQTQMAITQNLPDR